MITINKVKFYDNTLMMVDEIEKNSKSKNAQFDESLLVFMNNWKPGIGNDFTDLYSSAEIAFIFLGIETADYMDIVAVEAELTAKQYQYIITDSGKFWKVRKWIN